MPRKRTNKARLPKQERGIRTREKLLDAAVEVYTEVGYHEATVEGLTRRAGVAVGSFYAYFHDQFDLFLSTLDRYIEGTQSALLDYAQHHPPEEAFRAEVLETAIENLIEAHSAYPGLLREAMRMMDHPEVRARFDRVDEVVMHWFEALLSLQPDLSPTARKAASFVVHNAAEGVIHRLVMDGGDMDRSQVARSLAQMIAAYISHLDVQPS